MTTDLDRRARTTEQSYADAASRVKRWRSLTWWGWALGVLFYLPVVVLPALPHFRVSATPEQISTGAAKLVGGMIFVVLAYLVSLAIGSVRRSRFAVSLCFVILGLLAASGQLSALERRGSDQRDLKQAMNELAQDSNARARERLEQGNLDFDSEAIDQAKARMTQATADGPRDQRITGEVAVVYLDRVQKAAQVHSDTTDLLLERSPLDPSWIRTPEDIEDARQRTLTFRDANRQLLLAFNVRVADIQREFEQRGLSDPGYARGFINGMQSRPDYKLMLDIRETDRQFAELLLQACDLLEEHWNDWEYDTSLANIVFNNDEVLERWHQIVVEVQQIAERQVALQRAIVGLPPLPPEEVGEASGESGEASGLAPDMDNDNPPDSESVEGGERGG